MQKDAFRCMVEQIRGAYAVMGGVDPPSAPLVLYALAGFDGEPTVSELADAAGVSLKTASRTLKELRRQGWVVLKEDPRDTRMKRVALTKAGVSAASLISSSFVKIAHRVVAQTSAPRPAALRATRRAAAARRGRLSGRAKMLGALLTLQVTAGLSFNSYVQHMLGNTGRITMSDTLSDGHHVGSVGYAPL